jgi:phosphoserine phosphatase
MNLIIQGSDIPTRDLKELAKLAGASGIEQITPQAFRLRTAQARDGVAEYCGKAKLDFAFVPENLRLADFGLLAMDMDSTLITIEVVDETADMLGIKPQVAQITAATMRGEIDFAESLTRRVALLAGLDESSLQQIYNERVQLSPGAERMLSKLKAAGIKTLLVSGGFTFFTERLKTRLNFDYAHSNTLEISNGKLTGRIAGPIVDASAKSAKTEEIRKHLGLSRDQVIAVGDGANDLKMMAQAGLSIAYHAKPIVREQATYALTYSGLDGIINFFE